MKSCSHRMKDVALPAAHSPSPLGEGLGWGLSGKSTADGHPPPPAPPLKGRGEDGFTLVELLVVIAILGLLMTIVALNVLPAQDKAMATKAKADIALLEQAAEQYRLDTMAYPPALEALRTPPAGLERPELYRSGGYIKKLPLDPWGRAYLFANPGQHGAIDIYSYGADGAPGGDGENADIGNW